MKTVRGIYLNLEESDYSYEFGDYKFYFSSEVYKKKFEEQLIVYIGIEEARFYAKYGIIIDLDEPMAFNLYNKIEKRGFKVEYKGKELLPLNLISFKSLIESGD